MYIKCFCGSLCMLLHSILTTFIRNECYWTGNIEVVMLGLLRHISYSEVFEVVLVVCVTAEAGCQLLICVEANGSAGRVQSCFKIACK